MKIRTKTIRCGYFFPFIIALKLFASDSPADNNAEAVARLENEVARNEEAIKTRAAAMRLDLANQVTELKKQQSEARAAFILGQQNKLKEFEDFRAKVAAVINDMSEALREYGREMNDPKYDKNSVKIQFQKVQKALIEQRRVYEETCNRATVVANYTFEGSEAGKRFQAALSTEGDFKAKISKMELDAHESLMAQRRDILDKIMSKKISGGTIPDAPPHVTTISTNSPSPASESNKTKLESIRRELNDL